MWHTHNYLPEMAGFCANVHPQPCRHSNRTLICLIHSDEVERSQLPVPQFAQSFRIVGAASENMVTFSSRAANFKGHYTLDRNEKTTGKLDVFWSKLFTLAATQICDRNTGKWINEKVLTGHSVGFVYNPSNKDRIRGEYYSGFKTHLRMSVGQFEALLQILAQHLKKPSTDYLTSPADWRYFPICSL